MFVVKIDPEAQARLRHELIVSGYDRPYVRLELPSPQADVRRGSNGDVVWTINRSTSWSYWIAPHDESVEEAVFVADGIRMLLLIGPRTALLGIQLRLVDGQVAIEEIVK